jgi:hypothetical protein
MSDLFIPQNFLRFSERAQTGAQPIGALATAPPSAISVRHEGALIDQRVADFIQRKKTLLGRFFPTDLDRQRDQTALRLAQTEDNFYVGTLDMACQARLQEIAERFDGWLRTLKLEARQQFTAFVLSRLEVLADLVEEHRAALIKHVRSRVKQVAAMSDMPAYAARMQQSIDEEFERRLQLLDQQLVHFEELATTELIRLPRLGEGGKS